MPLKRRLLQKMNETTYPLLPLRDIVVFPHMIVPLFVGRKKSVSALEQERRKQRTLVLATQKNPGKDEPTPKDIYSVGVFGKIIQHIELPDRTVKVLVEGQQRVKITAYEDNPDFFDVHAEPLEQALPQERDETIALMRAILNQFEHYAKLNRKITTPEDMVASIAKISNPAQFADSIAAHIHLKISDKQAILEAITVSDRLEKISKHIHNEINLLKMEKRIQKRVKTQMDKSQKEYYLNEQMKAIQHELGDHEEGGGDLNDLQKKIKKTKLSKEAREKAEGDLKKLRSMSMMSAEANVIRNYLDWLLSIPWNQNAPPHTDLKEAEKILEHDHYGLKKVKERVLEYLAVQKRTKKIKGPILCLVGPPGVGKTSLGKSIAEATQRNFVRVSLGGVRDESEIRGHRRTYIGSMPGKIIQGMKKSKTSNPLFLLDEIDKMGNDWRGDPSSALLEVLDPEQNKHFSDHYLEVDYDLSNVLFITTANTLNMQQPLLDRLEVIRIEGYTENEKVEIAKRHLIPKLQENHAIKEDEWSISEKALRHLIQAYTREAGVRNMERELAKIIRKTIYQSTIKKLKHIAITEKNIQTYSGIPKYRSSELLETNMIGVATGLAWTQSGGEILTIESVTMPGKGKFHNTGTLGDVMKESIQAAISFVRSRAPSLGITNQFFDRNDIHVHIPEGATPKDGPSAGIALVLAITSCLTRNPINRLVAMTGEITLSGRVLPIGGLKEKMIAALRNNVEKIIIPKDNVKDLDEIDKNIKDKFEIIPITVADEIFHHALTNPIEPITQTQPQPMATPNDETLRTH